MQKASNVACLAIQMMKMVILRREKGHEQTFVTYLRVTKKREQKIIVEVITGSIRVKHTSSKFNV